MHDVKIGIYEKALPLSSDWLVRFESAKQAGYDFVEISIDDSAERLSRLEWSNQQKVDFISMALNTGIRLNSITLSAHRRYPMGSVDPKIRERALDIMRQAIDFVVDTGFRIIQLSGYYVFYEDHSEDNYAYFCESLAQAVEYAAQAGVVLAIENVDGQDILTVEQIMHFVEMFDSPFLQVYPDIGNLAANGFDVASQVKKAQGHLIGIHLKDVRPNVFRRVPFGEGIVPFGDAFRALAEINYTGNYLIEMWNDDSPESMQVVTDARLWLLEQMQESKLLA